MSKEKFDTANPLCALCTKPFAGTFIENLEANGTAYTVFFCRECMVGSTFPMPSPKESAELYVSGEYRLINGKRFNPLVEFLIHYFSVFRRRRIEKYMKGERILDVGCGRGLFLDVMRRGGWQVVAGTELNKETASYAAMTYGIDVVTGGPEEWKLEDRSFDVITINHVLEHVRDPLGMIRECRRLLRAGGLLVISVPNIASLQASVGRRAWFHLDVPYHLHHFSEKGLLALLKKNSFNILRTRRFDIEYNPFGWLQTLLNLSGAENNFLYRLLKSRELWEKELPRIKKRELILTFVLLPFYFPLSLLLSVFESFILRRGGTIEVYAVKE